MRIAQHTRTQGSLGVQRALWGLNGSLDIGDESGDDNLFLRGPFGAFYNRLEP